MSRTSESTLWGADRRFRLTGEALSALAERLACEEVKAGSIAP